MGPLACSSKLSARPSQNWDFMYAALRMLGAETVPLWPRIPVDTGDWSVQPLFGSWHDAHETVASRDRRLSKKRVLPSAAFASLTGLSGGTGGSSSPSGTG